MQGGNLLHLLTPDNTGNLHERLDVVVGGEQGELARQEECQNHTSRPDVDSYAA